MAQYYNMILTWVTLVRVHNNTEEPRVCIDELSLETDLQVMEDRGIVQVSQVGHVFALLKLGRVDLTQLLSLEHFFLWVKTFFVLN